MTDDAKMTTCESVEILNPHRHRELLKRRRRLTEPPMPTDDRENRVPPTPRPWFLDASRPPRYGLMAERGGGRDCIAVIGRGEWTGAGQEQNEADARFLVRAVNYFDDLVALAKAIADGVDALSSVASEIRERARRVIESLEQESLLTDS